MTPETDAVAAARRKITSTAMAAYLGRRREKIPDFRKAVEDFEALARAAGAEKEREWWRRKDAEESRMYAEGYERAKAEGTEEALAQCAALELVYETGRHLDALLSTSVSEDVLYHAEQEFRAALDAAQKGVDKS
jgi:flagellar biosynthesis/type III secretory pathway protein FliH